LARLALRGDETVLDAGCGSGRVTLKLLEQLPNGRVVAADGDPAMVTEARSVLGARATVIHSDLLSLELAEPVDVVFSSAVFHWITDHDTLFARLFAALRPGGRLVAQCGGQGNLSVFRGHSDVVAARAPYADHFVGWTRPWNYAAPEKTAERLRRAGFADVQTWLQPWEVVTPPEQEQFLRTICLRPQYRWLPAELRDRYIADVIAEAGEPLRLDFVRLHMDARR
jgi:trans-aconitate 2-methyltransferase